MKKHCAKFPLYASFIVTMITSCKTETKYPKEIAQLDSLFSAIDTTEKLYKAIDTAEIFTIYRKVNQQIDFIQSNYKDTLNFEDGLLVSNYHGILKPIKTLDEHFKEINEEAEFTKKQIQSLLHDLKNNLTEPDSTSNYVIAEKQAAEKSIQSMETMNRMVKDVKEKFGMFNPKMEELLTRIQSK